MLGGVNHPTSVGVYKPLRLMLEDIDFKCKYFGCDSYHKYNEAFQHLIDCNQKPVQCL